MSEQKKKKINLKKVLIIMGAIVIGIILLMIAIPIIVFWPIIYEMFFVYPAKPIEKHGEFPFELVYEYKGKEVTIKDTITCDYKGTYFSIEGGNSRDWKCSMKHDDEYGHYYIDKENYPDLYIVVPEYPEYYMGAPDENKEYSEPYIHYTDEASGAYYEEKESIDIIDIKITKWKPSTPLKNNFK